MSGALGLIVRLTIILALAVRLVPAPALVLTAAVDPLRDAAICHAGAEDGLAGVPKAPSGAAHDCLLCPVCLTGAIPLGLTPAPAALPAPTATPAAAAARPPATGPPLAWPTPAQPRAPPAV